MKTLTQFSITVLLFAVAGVPLSRADGAVTVEGMLVSASCYLADGSTGADHHGMKGCGIGCLKQGKPGGLLTKDNKFHMLDAPAPLLAPYVGQQLRVTGVAYGEVISVKKAEVNKDGKWEEIKIHGE